MKELPRSRTQNCEVPGGEGTAEVPKTAEVPGGEGTAEVPNAKAELAGQTTDEYMAVQRSEFPAVDTIEGSGEEGALPDAVEERDRKAATIRLTNMDAKFCDVCGDGHNYIDTRKHAKCALCGRGSSAAYTYT